MHCDTANIMHLHAGRRKQRANGGMVLGEMATLLQHSDFPYSLCSGDFCVIVYRALLNYPLPNQYCLLCGCKSCSTCPSMTLCESEKFSHHC